KRKARGQDLPPETAAGRVILGYRGLDGEERRTVLRFSPTPARLDHTARYDLALAPKEEATLELTVACLRGRAEEGPASCEEARAGAEAALERQQSWSCHVRAADGRFDAWVRRAESDLHMMTSELPTGPYPYAGVPWFNTPFGRDGIVTALECLWLRP